jgi:hypothetical protein
MGVQWRGVGLQLQVNGHQITLLPSLGHFLMHLGLSIFWTTQKPWDTPDPGGIFLSQKLGGQIPSST